MSAGGGQQVRQLVAGGTALGGWALLEEAPRPLSRWDPQAAQEEAGGLGMQSLEVD